MTKKHFIAIAAEIKTLLDDCDHAVGAETESYIREGIKLTAHALCRVFVAENPRFDSHRFLAACGVLN